MYAAGAGATDVDMGGAAGAGAHRHVCTHTYFSPFRGFNNKIILFYY